MSDQDKAFEAFVSQAKRYGVRVPRRLQAQHRQKPKWRSKHMTRLVETLAEKGRCVVTWNREAQLISIFTFEGYQQRVSHGHTLAKQQAHRRGGGVIPAHQPAAT